MPYIAPSGELKTKPTQHSVAALRSIGIQPDALVCRSDREIGTGLKRKISLMCDVEAEGVISCPDAPSIYDIPKVLHREGLDAYVVRRLGLPFRDVDWTVWGDLLDRVHRPKQTVTVALVGKYIDLPDAYLSVTEALRAGGFAHRGPGGDPLGALGRLPDARGGGAGAGRGRRRLHPRRVRRARHRGQARRDPLRPGQRHPDCWGCAWACSAWSSRCARDLAGLEKANSAEFDPDTPDPVIATMASQVDVISGERGHGRHHAPGQLPGGAGARVGRRGGVRLDRHHRAAPAPVRGGQRLPRPAAARPAWCSPAPRRTGLLVEFVELPRDVHPFFVGTQAHPELKSRPTRPHPLFRAFVAAAIDYSESARLPVPLDEAEKVGI